MSENYYRNEDCPNCGRHRVQADGVCEKCGWDVDYGDYECVVREVEWDGDDQWVHLSEWGSVG